MQGTSSLSGYAGQSVSLSGTGSLVVANAAVILAGSGSLTPKAVDLAAVESFTGAGYLSALASGAVGSGVLPPLESVGSLSTVNLGAVEILAAATLPAGAYVSIVWVTDHYEVVLATSSLGVDGYIPAGVTSGNYTNVVLGTFQPTGETSTATTTTGVGAGSYVYSYLDVVVYAGIASSLLESTDIEGYVVSVDGTTATILSGYFVQFVVGPVNYSIGAAEMLPLETAAWADEYVPPVLVQGFGVILPAISSGAIILSNPGTADADMLPAISRGSDFAFGIGDAEFAPLASYAYYGDGVNTYMLSGVEGASVSEMVSDMVIILTSEGTLAASFTADRIAVTQFLSDITGESSFAVTVELLTSLLSSGGFTDSLSAAVGNKAAVDGQVWVVNLATEASSQYDDFGFNSFFTHEGRHYGVASDGIYLLEGTTDNGEVIESMVDFGINNCGLPHRKKITNVRIGTTDGADTVLEVTTDTGTREYKLEKSKEGDFFWRARMPHVQQGVYWRFVLKSSTQFELNSIDFAPANLTRRF